MSLVSFVHVAEDRYETLKKSIEKSLDLINFDFGRKARKIVIKPNMCYYYHPSTGEVTDPYFVGVLIDVLMKHFADAEIFVVESDASAMKCKYAFHILGYDKLARDKGVNLVNLSEGRSRTVDVEVNNAKFTFYLHELFYEADLVVNVPKPKYMNDVKITCALKNMFGCNAYPRKYVYHWALNEAIVGINKLIKTDLVVLDGLVVSGKYTKKLNLVMSSMDPVALDAAAAKIMGIEPKSVKQIVLASREGLGSLSFFAVGDYLYAAREFPKKGFKDNVREAVASFYLEVMRED
ncbi:MAG: DUF362 domain-containing protein [Nitrososphaeria archaeon]